MRSAAINSSLFYTICILVGLTIYCQAQQLEFQHYSLEDGLSQTTVYDIIRDRQGFMWFATEDGLNRFDGYEFKVFKHDPLDSTTIAGNIILCLLEDAAGMVWIGTSKGLCQYNQQTETFMRYTNSSAESASPSDKLIQTLYQHQPGTIWIGTFQGLSKFDTSTENFTHYVPDADSPNTLPDHRIFSVLIDRHNHLWVGTANGLAKASLNDDNSLKFNHFRSTPEHPDSLIGKFVYALYEDEDGILWIGTQAGLHRYEKGQGSFQRYLPDAENPHSLNNETVWKIAGGEQDIIYIATFGGGLNKFDKRTGRFTHYTNDPNRTSSIGDNRILSIFPDADLHGGGLWLGTMTSGVQVHFPHRRKFIHYRHNPDDPNSLSNDAVYALAEDYHGYVWIGTSNGLNRFDPRSKKFLRYYQDASKPPGLLDNRVTSIYAGDSGTLWIGTFAGVSKFDSESNRFLDRNTYQALASLGGTTIWCFHRDRSGSLWIGTRTGLYRYVKNNDRLTLFEHDPGDPQSLTNNDVRCIYEDQTGRLWIGTLGGLDILDRNENHFYHLTYFPNDPQGLSDRIIWTVREDSKGNLWVGTKGGLNRLVEVPEVKQDTIRAQFTPFTEEEGLPNNSVYAILEDDHGFLWLSTNRGISKFDPLNTTFENFDMNDGLQSSEFNYGAHLKSERGGLYFGGVNGFNVFHPDSIPKNTHRPPVVITEFKIFDQPVEFNHSITSANRLELSHNENFFSFSFAALDYADPSKNQYQYQLVGFNREWIDAGHRRYASYTNVPPGHYVFRVIGANNDGVWNREGTSVNIFISPPYWQTWWFRILGLLAVGALLYAFYRMRVHQLIEVERTRTRIARDLHDELSATLSSISFFSDAIRSTDLPKLSKENRRYLNLINESAAEARESMGDIIWAVNPENDRWDQFLAGLRRYASDLLSSKNILYQFELPEELPHKTIEMEKQRDVWLIFKEIITNVVKHSECSKVSIVLANSRNSLQVRINDDGKGFDPSCQDSGNGINNIRERAKMLNAECRLETSPGHGTRWELSFKL